MQYLSESTFLLIKYHTDGTCGKVADKFRRWGVCILDRHVEA